MALSLWNMMRRICLLFPLLLVFPAVSEGAMTVKTSLTRHTYNRTWKDAQTHCRMSHTDLVTVTDEDKFSLPPSTHVWIGLYREGSNNVWKWSGTNEAADHQYWISGHPREGEHCALMAVFWKTWQSDDCNASHGFVCNNEKLVLVKEEKTWQQALMHCRALETVESKKPDTFYQDHRYDLATLLTPDDHDSARKKAQGSKTDEVWTGLRYLAGEWLWVGGEALQYTDIERCPGLNSCGVLVKNGKTLFETRKCDEKKSFLCYRRV